MVFLFRRFNHVRKVRFFRSIWLVQRACVLCLLLPIKEGYIFILSVQTYVGFSANTLFTTFLIFSLVLLPTIKSITCFVFRLMAYIIQISFPFLPQNVQSSSISYSSPFSSITGLDTNSTNLIITRCTLETEICSNLPIPLRLLPSLCKFST